MTVDDYTLAAFLSGELPERERRTVAAALLVDEEARTCLHMACEALAAVYAQGNTRRAFQDRVRAAPARPAIARGDREPKPSRRHTA